MFNDAVQADYASCVNGGDHMSPMDAAQFAVASRGDAQCV
jgi:hypothetical protein